MGLAKFCFWGVLLVLVNACGQRGLDYHQLRIQFKDSKINSTNTVKESLLPKIFTALSAPTSQSEFNCFAVNVSGPGILPSFPNNACIRQGFKRPGITGGFASTTNGSLLLTVPSGTDRTLSLYFVKTTEQNCPPINTIISSEGNLNGNTTAYRVATKTVDIFEDVEISLSPTYTSATASENNWFCDSGPSISTIAAQASAESTATSSINFTISSDTVSASSLTLSAISSNQTLLPNANIIFSGSDSSRSVILTPENYKFGTAVVTLTVSDGSSSTSIFFNYTVTSNGMEAAQLVLGQADFTSSSSGTTSTSMNWPIAISASTSKLAVADRFNYRVLLWNSTPTTINQTADIVLGQPDFTTATSNNGGVAADSMAQPLGVQTNGTAVAVSDSSNNRALLWTSFPTSNMEASSVVIGQSSFTTASANAFGSMASFGDQNLNVPYGIALFSDLLFIGDTTNSRVLKYNSQSGLPSTSGVADVALATTNLFGAGSGACAANAVNTPRGIATNGTVLVVTDDTRHRAFIWNTIPTSNNTAPDVVLGQTNFTSCSQNQGASAGANTLNEPMGIAFSGSKLIIADGLNSRVLVWNTIPTSNGQAADMVYGQPDFTTTTSGTTAEKLSSPRGVAVAGSKLYIADTGNNRVLVFDAP